MELKAKVETNSEIFHSYYLYPEITETSHSHAYTSIYNMPYIYDLKQHQLLSSANQLNIRS